MSNEMVKGFKVLFFFFFKDGTITFLYVDRAIQKGEQN